MLICMMDVLHEYIILAKIIETFKTYIHIIKLITIVKYPYYINAKINIIS